MSGAGEATQVLDLGLEVKRPAPAALDLGAPATPWTPGPDQAAMPGVSLDVVSDGSAAGAMDSPFAHTGATQSMPVFATHDLHIVSSAESSALPKIALAVVIVVISLGVYVVSDEARTASLLAMIGLSDDEPVVAEAPKRAPPPVQPVAPARPEPEVPAKPVLIWNEIKNTMGGDLDVPAEAMTADQEAAFSAGMSSQFTYQRYKTVLDIAAARVRGTEDLLRKALESPKLWTRMRALIALADSGSEITDDDVRAALGDAHSELRARFFKRFEKSPCSMGCFYVARAALPFLDALGREEVMRVISRENSPVRDLFMAAAIYDESERVRLTAQEWLDRHDVKPGIWAEAKKAAKR